MLLTLGGLIVVYVVPLAQDDINLLPPSQTTAGGLIEIDSSQRHG